MKYLQNFLKKWEENHRGSMSEIGKSALSFIEKIQSSFDYKDHLKALLLGQVQSGKTSQMLAGISCLADQEFKLFILLTANDNKLHEQTYERTLEYLGADFCVCSEVVDARFKINDLKQPSVLVLKKEGSILKTWKEILSSMESCRAVPGVIFDDEADTASLNTKVNQKDTSPINRLLKELSSIPSSSIYVQVTATPQAILLQTDRSGWKPGIVHIFQPGKGYCGGKHFYGEGSKCIRHVPENEKDILLSGEEIPPGLSDALLCFLANVIYLMDFRGRETCNFLLHPGIRTGHHDRADKKVDRLLRAVKEEAASGSELLRLSFAAACEDLRKSCPKLPPFEYFWSRLAEASNRVRRQILNCKEPINIDYKKGANILIGGNGTGRGVTFPALQVVYYCRESKAPLADTLWQHSRIFGYDRHFETCRLFLPPQLLGLFQTLNEENDVMFEMLSRGMPAQSVLYKIQGSLPTRKNVLDQEALSVPVGGVDYYVGGVSHKTTESIDDRMGLLDREAEIPIHEASELLSFIDPESKVEQRRLSQYASCLNSLQAAGYDHCHLIVRIDRDISKDSGTLLSPTDRKRSSSIPDKPVLILYRVNGQLDKGWKGKPVWVPNIRFPKGKMFYGIDEESC